ncbi:MAG TPA: hypothetical protein VIW29_08785 [Polyangiaceae bacterium]
MARVNVVSWIVGALALTVLGGCQMLGLERDEPVREPFIALERDFQRFESWHQIDLAQRPAIGETHQAGEAREFINRMPAPGSKTFPVGTILMKTVKPTAAGAVAGDAAKAEDGKAAKRGDDIFAMVKRGGGYNPHGSVGWEWFELRRRDDGTLGILWRGVNPPDGEGYGRDAQGGCNDCHRKATPNDYVHASALTLWKL